MHIDIAIAHVPLPDYGVPCIVLHLSLPVEFLVPLLNSRSSRDLAVLGQIPNKDRIDMLCVLSLTMAHMIAKAIADANDEWLCGE